VTSPEAEAEALRLIEAGQSDRAVASATSLTRRRVAQLRATGAPPDAPPSDRATNRATDRATSVVLHLSERELDALTFHLQATRLGGPLTVEAWVNRIAGQVAADVLRNAAGPAEVPAMPTPLRARRCPTCGGHVLIDHGARCLTPGCGWTGKA
jgi:hypothetical protein